MKCSFLTFSSQILTVMLVTVVSVITAGPRPARLMVDGRLEEVRGGLDFSSATWDPVLGRRCIVREEQRERLERRPRLECDLRASEECHTSYVTRFRPRQEEVCDETFVKTCHITFSVTPVNTTIRDCFKPMIKKCQHSRGM